MVVVLFGDDNREASFRPLTRSLKPTSNAFRILRERPSGALGRGRAGGRTVQANFYIRPASEYINDIEAHLSCTDSADFSRLFRDEPRGGQGDPRRHLRRRRHGGRGIRDGQGRRPLRIGR